MNATETNNGKETVTPNRPTGNYAPVNGVNMYYEVHGTRQPLVLLHGALSAIGTSFGKVLPLFAASRQVIAVELQAHGHTPDIDRPLSYEQLADDAAALLRHLDIENSDIFGYSMGAGVALQVGMRHPELVRKLVLASVSYNSGGLHPGLAAGMEKLEPEHLAGSPFQEEYARVAPEPENWPVLISKIKQLDSKIQDWLPGDIQAIKAPTLLLLGDSDIIRPEHTVELFRLLGGGVAGDIVGLPKSQLAILPGTTHISIMDRTDWLTSMILPFLDLPMPEHE